jgi:hypothetical protein
MKKSDIYEIAIKLFGIYLFVNYVTFTSAAFLQYYHLPEFSTPTGLNIIQMLLCISVIIFSLLLIFKTPYITRLVTSAKDYEEDAKLFADSKVVYEIALVIIGGIAIVWTLPDFADRLYYYVFFNINHINAIRTADSDILITAGIKLFLGIVAISYAKTLAAYFNRNANVTSKDGL